MPTADARCHCGGLDGQKQRIRAVAVVREVVLCNPYGIEAEGICVSHLIQRAFVHHVTGLDVWRMEEKKGAELHLGLLVGRWSVVAHASRNARGMQ